MNFISCSYSTTFELFILMLFLYLRIEFNLSIYTLAKARAFYLSLTIELYLISAFSTDWLYSSFYSLSLSISLVADITRFLYSLSNFSYLSLSELRLYSSLLILSLRWSFSALIYFISKDNSALLALSSSYLKSWYYLILAYLKD